MQIRHCLCLLPVTYVNNVPSDVPLQGVSVEISAAGLPAGWSNDLLRTVPLPFVSMSSVPTPPPVIVSVRHDHVRTQRRGGALKGDRQCQYKRNREKPDQRTH